MNNHSIILCPFCKKQSLNTSFTQLFACHNHNELITFQPSSFPPTEFIYLSKNGLEVEFTNNKAIGFFYKKTEQRLLSGESIIFDNTLTINDYIYDGDGKQIFFTVFDKPKTYENCKNLFYKLSKLVPFL